MVRELEADGMTQARPNGGDAACFGKKGGGEEESAHGTSDDDDGHSRGASPTPTLAPDPFLLNRSYDMQTQVVEGAPSVSAASPRSTLYTIKLENRSLKSRLARNPML